VSNVESKAISRLDSARGLMTQWSLVAFRQALVFPVHFPFGELEIHVHASI